MIFEMSIWGLAKLLIRLTKKFGIDWLKTKFNIDEELSKLIYDCIDNPTKIGDLLHYLYEHKTSVKAIEAKIPEVQKLPEVKNEQNLIFPGTKVEVYNDFLEEVFMVCKVRKHPIVLEGFFNGINYVSYFKTKHDGNNEIKKGNKNLEFNYGTEIIIEEIANAEQRKERIAEQRRILERNSYANYDLIDTHYKVKSIFDNYIEPEGIRHTTSERDFDLKFDIDKDNSGFSLMKKSLQDYINEIIEDVRNLKNLSRT